MDFAFSWNYVCPRITLDGRVYKDSSYEFFQFLLASRPILRLIGGLSEFVDEGASLKSL